MIPKDMLWNQITEYSSSLTAHSFSFINPKDNYIDSDFC